MEMRRILAVLGSAALISPCTSGSEQRPETRRDAGSTPSPTVASAALVSELPETCSGLPRPMSGGEISFVVDDHLYLADEEGSVTCVGALSGARSLEWNGTGEKALVGDDQGTYILDTDGGPTQVSAPASAAGFSRPTGTSMWAVSGDRASLSKILLARPENRERVTFLDATGSVTYHPAGTHIVASGVGRDGTYGIYLADNLGRDARLLAHGESFEKRYDPSQPRIAELDWSRRGDILYFTADHSGRHHLHSLSLGGSDGSFEPVRLSVVTQGPEPITSLRVSEFDGRRRVAFARGSCAAGFTTSVAIRRRDVKPLRDVPGSVVPVGWLPDGRLVVAASEEPCGETSDLYLWSEEEVRLLVEGVSVAAIRAVLPEPPDPPAPVGDQVVA